MQHLLRIARRSNIGGLKQWRRVTRLIYFWILLCDVCTQNIVWTALDKRLVTAVWAASVLGDYTFDLIHNIECFGGF